MSITSYSRCGPEVRIANALYSSAMTRAFDELKEVRSSAATTIQTAWRKSSLVRTDQLARDSLRELNVQLTLFGLEKPAEWECPICLLGTEARLNLDDPQDLTLRAIVKTNCPVTTKGGNKSKPHVFHTVCLLEAHAPEQELAESQALSSTLDYALQEAGRLEYEIAKQPQALRSEIELAALYGRLGKHSLKRRKENYEFAVRTSMQKVQEDLSSEDAKRQASEIWFFDHYFTFFIKQNSKCPTCRRDEALMGVFTPFFEELDPKRYYPAKEVIKLIAERKVKVKQGAYQRALELKDFFSAAAILESGKGDQISKEEKGELLSLAWPYGEAALESLLDAGIPIDSEDKEGKTQLYSAVLRSDVKSVRWLLRKGSSPNKEQGPYGTSVHLAVQQNEGVECLEALLEEGADPNAVDKTFKRTPLHWAVIYQRTKAIHVLLKHGANPKLRGGKTGLTAPQLAKRGGYEECFKVLESAAERLP